MNEKKAILSFLRGQTLATISTVNNKTLQPESALVAFAELDSLEILFVTLRHSRKAQNLKTSNKVAMVIGWNSNPRKWATLQYEGQAFPVTGLDESKYRNIFLSKKDSPCTPDFFLKPQMKLFKVTPTWIGFSSYPPGQNPHVIEIKQF